MPKDKKSIYPVRKIGLSEIIVDHSIQSRASMSVEDERLFSEAMLRGDQFPAVTVFDGGGRYILADGFHRYGASASAAKVDSKFNEILAEIRPGGRRDAIVFSAGANKKFSIRRTDADRKRALFMLLSDDEWFGKPIGTLASHIGIGPIAVKKWRSEFCEERGLAVPVAEKLAAQPVSKVYSNGQGGFICSVRGKAVYLGTNEEAAKKKRDSLATQHVEIESVNRKDNAAAVSDICRWLLCRDVVAKGVGNPPMSGLGQAFACRDTIFVVANFEASDKITEVVGRLLLNRHKHNPQAKIAVVCDKSPNLSACGVARELGVEFLRPGDLLGVLKAGQSDAGAA